MRARTPSLLAFFFLSYALAWLFFLPLALAGPAVAPLAGSLGLIGSWAPALSALALTWRSEGKDGLRRMIAPIFRARVAGRWYAVAALGMVTVKLTVALILRASTGAWPHFGTEPIAWMPLAVAISTPVQAGEEIGWRAFALPRLADRVGLRLASLILGAI